MIGSVKSNIGHLEAASGIAGLIKCVLMLENAVILPNHDFQEVNERIPLDGWRMRIAAKYEPWEPPDGIPRRLSINSFGYGGTNAHAILDEAPRFLEQRNLPENHQGMYARLTSTLTKGVDNGVSSTAAVRIFVLSAADPMACMAYATALGKYLRHRQPFIDDYFLDSLAHTLNERRSRMRFVAPVYARSTEELIERLASKSLEFTKTGTSETLAFVFTGQGAQWPRMGQDLMAFPTYRRTIERCSEQLKDLEADWDLVTELSRDASSSRIHTAELSQPLCTALQIALVALLASWGIAPSSVTGHSSGEIAAAYAAGALTLEDAITVAYHRGVGSQAMATDSNVRGAMMAVGMSSESAQPLIDELKNGQACVACVNSPSSITVSGDVAAIDELAKILEHQDVFARRLQVPVAYHSHHMQTVSKEYARAIAHIRPRQGNVN